MHAIGIKPYVTVRHFSDWLSNLAYVISTVTATSSIEITPFKKKPKEILHSSAISRPTVSCTICKNSHRLIDCEDFKKKTIEERWNFVKSNHLCFACLRYGHATSNCRSRRPCNVNGCKRIHNPLLHEIEAQINAVPTQVAAHGAFNCASTENTSDVEVLFKIIPIRLYGKNRRSLDTFAMIDEGSSVTLIDESILHQLELQGQSEQLTLQ